VNAEDQPVEKNRRSPPGSNVTYWKLRESRRTIPELKAKATVFVFFTALACLCAGCGKKHDGKTIGGWKDGLSSEKESDRRAAVKAMSEIGKSAVPALRDALKGKDKIARSSAARSLGEIGPDARAAVPELIKALSADDVDVRRNAVFALGKIGVASVPALTKSLKHADPNVRKNAVAALGKIDRRPARPFRR
jgi:HEAT repeat protein